MIRRKAVTATSSLSPPGTVHGNPRTFPRNDVIRELLLRARGTGSGDDKRARRSTLTQSEPRDTSRPFKQQAGQSLSISHFADHGFPATIAPLGHGHDEIIARHQRRVGGLHGLRNRGRQAAPWCDGRLMFGGFSCRMMPHVRGRNRANASTPRSQSMCSSSNVPSSRSGPGASAVRSISSSRISASSPYLSRRSRRRARNTGLRSAQVRRCGRKTAGSRKSNICPVPAPAIVIRLPGRSDADWTRCCVSSAAACAWPMDAICSS